MFLNYIIVHNFIRFYFAMLIQLHVYVFSGILPLIKDFIQSEYNIPN